MLIIGAVSICGRQLKLTSNMKYDITIKEENGELVAEYIMGEQTKDFVIRGCDEGVEQGDGHEVPIEDI